MNNYFLEVCVHVTDEIQCLFISWFSIAEVQSHSYHAVSKYVLSPITLYSQQ